GHFFAAAAEAMRCILVESARRKQRKKRGGGRRQVDIEEHEEPVESSPVEQLAWDDRRYYGPIRHPTWPRLSLTGCELTAKRGHRVGFPVLLGSSPCCLPSPLPRQDQAEASSFARYPGCGLPLQDGGLAPASPVFGACSVFTRVTAC